MATPQGFIPNNSNDPAPTGYIRVVGPNGERGFMADPSAIGMRPAVRMRPATAAGTRAAEASLGMAPLGQQPPPKPPGVPFSYIPATIGALGDVGAATLAGALLPESGGASAVAAPAMMAAGGGLGQLGGRALQMALLRATHYPGADTMSGDYGSNALQGAGASLLGQVGAGVARGIARPLMATALKTADSEAIRAALENNIAPGRGMFKGTGGQQVERATSNAVGKQTAIISDMARAGKFSTIDEVSKPIEGVLDQLGKDAKLVPELAPEYNALVQRWSDFVDANKGKKLAPQDVQRIKQVYDSMLRSVWKKDAAGQVVSTMTDRDIAYNKAAANSARSILEAMDPRIRPANAKLQGLMALSPAMAGAEGKQSALRIGAAMAPTQEQAVPHVGAWFNPFGLVPPHVPGVAALALNNRVAPMLRAFPWLANLGYNVSGGPNQ